VRFTPSRVIPVVVVIVATAALVVIEGEATNFVFEFALTARTLSGTVTVTGAAGEKVLVMTWSE